MFFLYGGILWTWHKEVDDAMLPLLDFWDMCDSTVEKNSLWLLVVVNECFLSPLLIKSLPSGTNWHASIVAFLPRDYFCSICSSCTMILIIFFSHSPPFYIHLLFSTTLQHWTSIFSKETWVDLKNSSRMLLSSEL